MKLINIGPYDYCGRIKLTATDGKVYVGEADVATMKEDEEELGIEDPSDWLTVIIDGRAVDFRPEDIKSIEKIA